MVAVDGGKFGIGGDGFVGLVEPDGEGEGFFLSAIFFKPFDTLGGDELGGVAFELTDFLPLRTKLSGFLWLGLALLWV